ncbi:hypothetical protein PG997_014577 [Apiospora hydei]|uniref:Uncharacterized protein n=1 Tax=Apiospora hydei TaxID=1337664 RepID=A0ABR1UWP4_9PEZI
MSSQPSHRARIAVELLGTNHRSFKSYFKVYDTLLAYSDDAYILQIENPSSKNPSPLTHEDILVATHVLRDDPTLTLDKACDVLEKALVPRYYLRQQLKKAILVSVRVMFMLGCEGSWKPNERFVDYIFKCFPKALSVPSATKRALESKKSLKAWKLKSKCHLSFQGTNNIADHLHLDLSHPDGPTLFIFHHTSFLNAHLDRLNELGFAKEEDLLFYLKRHRLRRRLSHPEGYKIFDDPQSLEYIYWADRLAALHAFVLERPPRNGFERWIKWQTSESNAFAIALLALLISIIVGVLSLVLASIQTWIAYKAWVEPVQVGDG